MCKCFFRFAKCLAVFVNVILLILGLGCLGGGIYALTQIDVKDLLGKTYNDSVPPIETFVPNEAKNDQTAKLTTKASKFVDESMEKIGRTSKKIFIGLIGLGAVMVFITLLGIMAFSCCNKNSCFVIVYLILLILVLVPFIVMTVFTADESFLKGMIFAKLDDLALKTEFVNRYFMAALQSQLKCCGVRGSVDYFCHGIYDFACNPGCMTFNRFWKAMVDKAGENNLKPMCTRVPEMVEQCRKMADKAEKIKKQNQNLKNLGQTGAALPPELAAFTKENCEKKMNVPKPVNGQTSEFCKSDNIENHFGKDGGWPKKRTMLEEALAKFDPAKNDSEGANPSVHGSAFMTASKRDEVNPWSEGCGFSIWKKVDMDKYMNIGMVFALSVVGLLVFEITLCIVSVCCNKKNKEKKSSRSGSKSGSNSGSKSGSKSGS